MHARGQELRQGDVEAVGCADQGVVDPLIHACPADSAEKTSECGEIAAAERLGVRQDLNVDVFHPLEQGAIGEGKLEFVMIEHVEHEHIMIAVAQPS